MKKPILIASLAAAAIAGAAVFVLLRSGGDLPSLDAPAATKRTARGSGPRGRRPGSGSFPSRTTPPESGSAPRATSEAVRPKSEVPELSGAARRKALTEAIANEDGDALRDILQSSLTEEGTRFAAEDLPLLFEALSGTRDDGLQKLALTHLSRMEGAPEVMVKGYLDYLRASERPALAGEVFREITRAGGDPALHGLAGILRETPSETMRWQAAQALGELRDARAIPALSGILDSIQEPRQAYPIAQSLIKIGGREAISSVLEYAAREGNEASLSALQELRDRDAAPILAESLTRRASEAYQVIALQRIRQLGNPEVIPALARYLDSAKGRAQGDAIDTLATLRDPRAARTLEEFAARQSDQKLAHRAQRGAQKVRAALERPEPKPKNEGGG